ncbi:MAG: UDP-N-acetylmuramate dehydrogenase [Verrucomicrobia bacterium]|jgi:UDP-N-acetylmuramate dehydrogenase|nr:UDP-N-acetylmuramate dehydrogenase [Verrucomicrobiota bacterium]
MAFRPERDVPLAPLTTWKIGGPAEWYAAPRTREDLLAALAWAKTEGCPLTILGRGSNVLLPDEGLSGLTVVLRHYAPETVLHGEAGDGSRLFETGAGFSLPRLAREAAAAGYGGYSFYIGIPGTVGGAVVMNAGFGPGDERQTAHRCEEVEALRPGEAPRWRPYADFGPTYRHTALIGSDAVVLTARFRFRERASAESLRQATAEHLAMRKRMQPLTRPTAGSVFKGTSEGQPAGRLIDEAGLKGLRIGGAVVSEKHANWIENHGGATAADVRALIVRIQERVQARTGIFLEPEVRMLTP